MVSEVVGVENDIGAVRILETLLRLEGFAECVGGNQGYPELLHEVVQVRAKDRMTVLLRQLNGDPVLCINEVVLLIFVAGSACKVRIPVDPDRKRVVVVRLKSFHIRRVVFHIEISDPFVIGHILVEDVGADLPVLGEDLILAVTHDRDAFLRPSLDEDIVVEAVVAVEDRHEAHHLGAVRDVVRRVALAQLSVDDAVASAADCGEGAADQVMYHRDALGSHAQGHIGEQEVVIDQGGAVADLDEDILTHHAALELLREVRLLVVVHQVLRDARALRLPVRPDPHCVVVDVVAAHDHVDRGVQLDAGDLGPAELHHVVDMMDMVVLNDREDAAHPSDDAALLAVVDIVAADDVAADLLLHPAVVLAAADRVALHLCRALDVLIGEVVVVVRIKIFPEADAGAFAVRDLAILDDPAL